MSDQLRDDATLSPDPPSSPSPSTLPPTIPGDVSSAAVVFRPTAAVSAEDPPASPTTHLTAGELPPVIGRPLGNFPIVPGYEILREIGRGGMGVVYQALQTKLNRPVALKMILAGAHAGPIHLARFQIEAETLAGLQHPNIVQLYEVGEHDHCPYLAMEYLDGVSLDRHLAGKPQPFESSASLIETLARAVHCAHLRGIIHRDLKPGNIILGSEFGVRSSDFRASGVVPAVTSSGVTRARLPTPHAEVHTPKLLDFGLAKRLEGESCTHDGAVMGTPSYMAPEQALGKVREIGPAADVYALGAILFEMLTGRPPFVGATTIQTLVLVQNEEPTPPSRFRRRLPRDLEVICLKCLQKNPLQRYATAEALADDLHSFLAREPIRARPVGVWERAWKWARRRPAVAALVGVCIAAVIVIVSLVISKNIDDREKNNRLREANVNLKAARDRAEARSLLVRTAVDEMYTQVAEQWLGKEPHMDALQEEFLNKARLLYEELARDESDDPVLQAETARAQFRIGQICRQLNKFEEAAKAYAAAIAAQERLVSRDAGSAQYRLDLANSYNYLGELHRATGHPREAAESYKQSLKLQRDLVRDQAAEPEYRKDEARSHYNLGLARRELNDLNAAKDEMESAVLLLEPLAQPDRTDLSYRQELARVRTNLGIVRAELKDAAGAEQTYDEAIRLQRDLTKADPKRPEYRHELAASLTNLGNLSLHQHMAARAQTHYEEARELLERLTIDFPSRPLYHQELANTCNSLAAVLYESNPQKAADLWKQSEREYRRLAEQWKNVPNYQHGRGQALGNRGWLTMELLHDPGTARVMLKEAVQILEGTCECNANNPIFRETLIGQYLNLSECLLRLKDYDGVEKTLTTMLAIKPPPQEPQRFAAARILAGAAEQSKRTADAEWAVRLLQNLDAAKLNAMQRALSDPKFDSLRNRPDVQELLRRWQAAQVKQNR